MLAFIAEGLRKGPAECFASLLHKNTKQSLSRLHRRAINYKVIYDQPYGRAKLWSELSTSLKATLRVSDLSFGSLKKALAKTRTQFLSFHYSIH